MASSRAGGSGGGASDSDGFSDDEFDLAVQAAIDRRIRQRQQRRQQAAAAVPRPIHRRRHVPRDHIAAHHRLYADYFAPEPRFGDALFRRRFRMHRPLFMHIVGALERRYEFFRIREDAAGKPGHTPIQKCTAAIRQLAYGGPADMFDEYLLHWGVFSRRVYVGVLCGRKSDIRGSVSSASEPRRLPAAD
ncbi:uncharacterized protein LOC125206853 [Salvia hispanica]|uniref:uncharacterized protein LOC125206853 n=1 Tax=Salvia hispanica TaxID=49212 RepID=UPI0020093F05|nr:uncharacterized protein LOC125206853 [Salvia hispanica]